MALKMLLLAKKLKDLRAAGEALQTAKVEIEGRTVRVRMPIDRFKAWVDEWRNFDMRLCANDRD